jgi:hypothetical protein
VSVGFGGSERVMRTSGRGNDIAMVIIPGGILALFAWFMLDGSMDTLRRVDDVIETGVLAMVNAVRSLF